MNTYTHEKFDIVTNLSTCRPKILKPNAASLLSLALEHGGFVAGGFARIVANDRQNIDIQRNSVGDQIYYYLNLGDTYNLNGKNPFVKVDRGDIDVFFPTHGAYVDFCSKLTDNLRSDTIRITNIGSSFTGAADNVICDGIMFQFIRFRFLPVEEMLETFDIGNVRVAFTNSEIIESPTRVQLEKDRILHVANFSGPYVFHRLEKMFRNAKYDSLSKETVENITPRLLDLVKKLKEQPITKLPRRLTYEKVLNVTSRFLPFLKNEDLLLLTSVYPADGDTYSPIKGNSIKILLERAGITS